MQASEPTGRPIADIAPARHINHTPFPSQYFQTVDQHGQAFHVIATRITYDMQSLWGDGFLGYAQQQTPLAMSDVWDGEPNESSPLWESDFAPYKPRCDVLVAHAVSRPPHGKRASRWRCGIALDWCDAQGQERHWDKELIATGPRLHNLLGLPREPALAAETRIHWQNAYGGHQDRPNGAGRTMDERNPVGCGVAQAWGMPAPRLEPVSKPYRSQRNYPPISLTATGRAWLPRRCLAGTYDEVWRQQQWPLPPLDFDHAYWNSAPVDQQIDYPTPGAQLRLIALYPPDPAQAWPERFTARLPAHQLFIHARLSPASVRGSDILADLDTLVVDFSSLQAYATYRVVMPAPEDWPGKAALVLETRMAAATSMDESVPAAELGPLG